MKNGMSGSAILENIKPSFVMAKRSPDFGLALAVANEDGISALRFGEDLSLLQQELISDNMQCCLLPASDCASEKVRGWLSAALNYAVLGGEKPDVPLSLKGNQFQMEVWRGILEVPEGEVISYGDLAEDIGHASSFRAVANACGQNGIAVLVPCHRVVRSDDTMSGYRWGMSRKRFLLEREGFSIGDDQRVNKSSWPKATYSNLSFKNSTGFGFLASR